MDFGGVSGDCISRLMSGKCVCLFRVCGGSFSGCDGKAPGLRALCFGVLFSREGLSGMMCGLGNRTRVFCHRTDVNSGRGVARCTGRPVRGGGPSGGGGRDAFRCSVMGSGEFAGERFSLRIPVAVGFGTRNRRFLGCSIHGTIGCGSSGCIVNVSQNREGLVCVDIVGSGNGVIRRVSLGRVVDSGKRGISCRGLLSAGRGRESGTEGG